jgi:hypothetical protein
MENQQIVCFILFLNSKKKFRKEQQNFYGEKAYSEAVKWGRENLENFIIDMVHFT